MAWRNIWRNGRRTAITVTAVALNTAVLIASYGLIEGMHVQLVHAATALVVGDAQVHAEGYRDDRSLFRSIADPGGVMRVAQQAGIQAAARAYGYGLLSHGSKSAGAMFWGVDPVAERRAFELAGRIDVGAFLGERAQGQVVVGRRLARSLAVTVGSELVAVVQAADGSLGNEILHVAGVFAPVGEEIDRAAAMLHRDDFERLFAVGGRVHEIALRAPSGQSPEAVRDAIGNAGGETARLSTWRQVLPLLSDMLELNASATWLFGLIFSLAAGLGVMNTMAMATHDRVREFGVLKALGASAWRIIADVTTEAFVLACVSTAIGVGLGVAAAAYLRAHGIDTTALGGTDISFGGITFDPIWRATLSWLGVVVSVMMMWVICVLASLYPAVRAARLSAAMAMTAV